MIRLVGFYVHVPTEVLQPRGEAGHACTKQVVLGFTVKGYVYRMGQNIYL